MQVAAVEGDFGFLALNFHHIQHRLALPHFLGTGGYSSLARRRVLLLILSLGRHLQADDVAAVPGKNRRRPGYPQQSLRIENAAGIVLLRYQLLVVGESPLHQLGNHFHSAGLEHNLAAGRHHHNFHGVILVGEQAAEFIHRPRRNDDPDFLLHRIVQGAVLHRQPEPVGCRQGIAVAAELGLNPGQHRARFLAGSGKYDPADGRLELLGVNAGGYPFLDPGHRRELAGRYPMDAGAVPAADEMEDAAVFLDGQIHPVAGQGVDKLRQQAGRHGDGPLLLNHRANPGSDGDFQVGRRQLQHRAVGLQQHILRNRQSSAAGHGPADDGEAAAEVFLQA